MSHLAAAFEPNTPLSKGLLQCWDNTLTDYVTVGGVESIRLTTDIERRESDASPGCSWGEFVRRHDASLRVQLTVPRNIWIWQHLYGFTPKNIMMGALTTVNESVQVSDLFGTHQYAAVLPIADALGLVQNVQVQSASAGTMVFGTDYLLQIYGGYTAIVAIPGGGLKKGDMLQVQYDVSPLEGVDVCAGLPTCRAPKRWRVLGTIADGVTEKEQNGTLSIIFPEADVVSAVQLSWAPCSSDSASFPIEIRNRPRTEWCMQFRSNPL